MKKGKAYIISLTLICLLSFLAVVSVNKEDRPAIIMSIFPGAIIGIVGVTTVFIGGNVADNGVKGKCFNENLVGK
jgi:hypothetical protein